MKLNASLPFRRVSDELLVWKRDRFIQRSAAWSKKAGFAQVGLPDMLRTKPIRTTMKVLAEVLDSMDVGADSARGKVAALQLLDHELT